MWDLPGPGLEPMSPVLAGRFLTTVPPGKSLVLSLLILLIPSSVFKLILSSEFQIYVSWCQVNISFTSDTISENKFILPLLWICFSPGSSVNGILYTLGCLSKKPASSEFFLVPVLWFLNRPWSPCLAYAVFSVQNTFPLLCLANPHCFGAELVTPVSLLLERVRSSFHFTSFVL